jgi:pantoate--beta-alanine ligase
MGALHEGHLSLVRLSRARCARTVASIFVNPLQFGPGEDLSRYPRPFERDRELLGREGVDALFAPEAESIYPADASTTVAESEVTAPLCGEHRPGHFRGVLTVVLKLFNLVRPDVAFFGQKDAQQCAAIERMVRDLDVPVELVRGPTVRESDGLAMSSRNAYLTPVERERAPLLHRSLLAARDAFARGERDRARLEALGRAVLAAEPAFRVQYWEIRDAATLARPADRVAGGELVAAAACLGRTRLIDNLVLPSRSGPGG